MLPNYDQVSIWKNDVDANQVIHSKAKLPAEPPVAARKCKASHPGVTIGTNGYHTSRTKCDVKKFVVHML